MAVTYSTVALVKKKGKYISSSLLDEDIEENIYEAEGFIDATMRQSARGGAPDFTFDEGKHSAIRNCCSELAAFISIIYDPGRSFLTLADAEIHANLLWNPVKRTLLMLSDPRNVAYLKGL